MAIDPELVERAIQQISKRRANYDYFFKRLDSPEWVAPLANRGLFADPPQLEVTDEGVRALAWPPSEFLERVAAKDPDTVVDVALGIETDNERVHENLVGIAKRVPLSSGRPLIAKELEWLRRRKHLYFSLPGAIVELAAKLAKEGEPQFAIDFVRELFRPPARDEGDEADPLAPIYDLKSDKISQWLYATLIDQAVEDLVHTAPSELINYLVSLVDEAALISYPRESERGEDYSQVWRPRLDSDERSDRNIFQASVTALRNAVKEARRAGIVSDELLLDQLLRGRSRVLRRVAALALASEPAPERNENVARILVDREAFFAAEPSYEYRRLMSRQFGYLDGADQRTILSWIEEGPDLNKVLESRAQRGESMTPSESARYSAVWRIRRLHLMGDQLPEEWKRRHLALVDEFGPAEFITSFEITMSFGVKSPADAETLVGLSDDEILGLLQSFEGHVDRWNEPSPEGLARELNRLAEMDPDRVSRFAPQLSRLRPIYAQWALIGITSGLREGRQVAWRSLVPLLASVAQMDVDRDEDARGDDDYGRWGWVKKEVAGVLEEGFQREESAVPLDLRFQCWDVLAKLCEDSDPTPEYEARYGGSNMDPVTLSLNTTRGRALRAVVSYALWVSRLVEANAKAGNGPTGFRLMPEVRDVLARHLDVTVEPSQAIRAVYGQRFPWILLVDEDWASAAAPVIFPTNGDASPLKDVAWTAYLLYCQPYNSCFRALRQQYETAVDRASHDYGDSSWIGGGPATSAKKLGEHLVAFYLRGLLDLRDEGGLLDRFFANALPETRKWAIEFLGRVLRDADDLQAETVAKAQAFWEWRKERLQHERPQHRDTEAAAISWWASSSRLEQEWRLSQIEFVLSLGVSPEPEFVTLAALADVAEQYPLRAVRALRTYLERIKEGWSIYAGRNEIRQILSRALEVKDPDAAEAARDTAHWLGSLGFVEFRDLIRNP
ncbi:hypothetical protein [Actinoplanes sp. NPDC049316]|uniref:hypothetical protein n=1 Tax=Actinoplanes sp. NPDC049316 TaxID=3154727 RepID=UPI0034476C47